MKAIWAKIKKPPKRCVSFVVKSILSLSKLLRFIYGSQLQFHLNFLSLPVNHSFLFLFLSRWPQISGPSPGPPIPECFNGGVRPAKLCEQRIGIQYGGLICDCLEKTLLVERRLWRYDAGRCAAHARHFSFAKCWYYERQPLAGCCFL